jgi:DNA-binding transcriptional MerR regulator
VGIQGRSASGLALVRVIVGVQLGEVPPLVRRLIFGEDRVDRACLIDVAQRVGFTLEEIRELLASDHGPAHQRLRHLAARKLPEIDALIRHAGAVVTS